MDSNSKKSDFMINFYEVLGVEETASILEIKKKYAELVKKYHPDKNPDDYDEALFQLIQRAYECLSNQEKRTEYDFFINNVKYSKNNDHIKLKQSYSNYKDLQDKKEISEEEIKRAKIEFEKGFDKLDKKHNFDRKKIDDTKLSNEEISSRFNDLMLQREQDELEFTQNNLFEGNNFNVSKFNAIFDLYKNGHNGSGEVTRYGNISAFNDAGNYTSINSMNDLYDDNDNTTHGSLQFSSVNFGKENKLDKDKLKHLNEANYTKNHNKKDDNYIQELERKMKERDQENNFYQNRKLDDFDTKDKSFQFLQEVGITDNILEFEENHEELLSACNKLIALNNNQEKQKK